MKNKNHVDPYSNNADFFFDQYNSLSFEKLHGCWLEQLSNRPGFALDVGAGSGRDALALARRGWEVVAVEPAVELRRKAEQFTSGKSVHWFDDFLPDLNRVRRLTLRFDLILVSAVWMHVPPNQRERAFRILTELLAPKGLLIITLRHGPIPAGRTFFKTDRGELEEFARKRALSIIQVSKEIDQLGRSNISWETLVFRLPDDGTGSLPLLRHIIVNDDKSSTYKLGLLRTITRIADSAPGMVLSRTDDWVEIPLGIVGLYWIKLYQPLILRYKLRQLPGVANCSFVKESFYHLSKVSPFDIRVGQSMESELGKIVLQSIQDACNTIRKMPAYYITFPGTKRPVFDVYPKSYRKKHSSIVVISRQELAKFGTFRVPTMIWDCCSRYACWIEPAIINEWSELIQSYENNADIVKIRLALQWEEGRRDTHQVRKLISSYIQKGYGVHCIWSNRDLRYSQTYEVDHCFPWSRWNNNDLWNLMPATKKANSCKGEKLPSATLLESSHNRILKWWDDAYFRTDKKEQFIIEAETALPLPSTRPSLSTIFEGISQQRLRIKMNQQLAEWHGLNCNPRIS